MEHDARLIKVSLEGVLIAQTRRAIRVLETSHPPTYYIPPGDVRMEFLRPSTGDSFCEWKGQATYYDLDAASRTIPKVAWTYLEPTENFNSIAGYLSFYPNKVACYLGAERVQAQAGGFYGGWITKDVVGPFKGEPGSQFW